MRNIPLRVSCCLLLICNVFNVWSNFTFAEETPMAIATPSVTSTPQSAETNVGGLAIFTITATKKTGNAKVKFGAANGLKTTATVKVKKE